MSEILWQSPFNLSRDLVAYGQQNVWICEVGSRRLNGSFEDFLQNIAASGKLINITWLDSVRVL